MALRLVLPALLLAIALANVGLSACHVVKGRVSCVDCRVPDNINLSGIRIVVKCDKVKKLSMATTRGDGVFETELPEEQTWTTLPAGSSPSSNSNCLAKVLGGPHQLYASRNNMVSKIVEARGSSGRRYFTISTPITVSTAQPDSDPFASSKTVDLPVPREWGLAPTSYYLPFVPIIGIP